MFVKRDTMEKMTAVGCCGWFGFSFAKKSNKVRGLGDSTSHKFLLDEETENEDDSFSNRDVADNENGEECDFQNPTKRAEENLRYRMQHGFICREFPVKETHSLLRSEDENGIKTVNEYVYERKIGGGSYGKVVLYRSYIDGKNYAIKSFHKSYLLKIRVTPSETAMSDVLRENIVHGDIKPDNLLITGSGAIKIGDFSVSQVFEDDNDELRRSPGTPVFTAPECCIGETYHGKAADTWAVGVTLYCMVLGKYPFLGETLQDTYDKIVNDPLLLPDEMNPLLKSLLKGLLCKDPVQRMTLEDVAQNAWVVGEDGPIRPYLCWCKRHDLQKKLPECSETDALI